MSAIDRYLSNNAEYVAGFSKGDLPMPPAREIAIVACMDARLETGALLGLAEGEAHVIRNAGGVVTDDVIRSLTISQRLLGTRAIMLIHHTDCGMLTFQDADVKDAIKKDTGSGHPLPWKLSQILKTTSGSRFARIKASPFVPHKDAIRGFVYEVETGRLREVK